MYLIDNKEILSINGVYNRVAIEENSIKHTTTENYYMPNDVVFIDNNKA
jgi:hypothetical protein